MEGSGTSELERFGSTGGLRGQDLLKSFDFLLQAFENRGAFREPFFVAEQLELLRRGGSGTGSSTPSRSTQTNVRRRFPRKDPSGAAPYANTPVGDSAK